MAFHGLALPNAQVVLSAARTRSPVIAVRRSSARFVFSSPSANRTLIVTSSGTNNPYTAADRKEEVAAGEDVPWRGPFALRVRLALNFKGLSYDYQEEDLANKSDLLLESNPVNKKVPVLIHNGVPICESLAILEYIDEVYRGTGPCLLPADPYQRAIARFWATYIDKNLVASWWKMFVGKTDKEKNEGTKQTLAAVEMLEEALRECSSGKPFFGGDNVGYVDVVLGGMVTWMQGTEALCGVELLDATKTPLLLAWMERFGGMEPAKVVLPDIDRLIEFAKMKRAQKALI